jgi:hypothetical protein
MSNTYRDIKVKPATYGQLVRFGTYNDSMDTIIARLLKIGEGVKKNPEVPSS